MAHKVCEVLEYGEKVLVVCGVGHMAYGCGVPERVWKEKNVKEETFMLYTRSK